MLNGMAGCVIKFSAPWTVSASAEVMDGSVRRFSQLGKRQFSQITQDALSDNRMREAIGFAVIEAAVCGYQWDRWASQIGGEGVILPRVSCRYGTL